MKIFRMAVLLVMSISILTLTGCTVEGLDPCELLNLSYFECLVLGL